MRSAGGGSRRGEHRGGARPTASTVTIQITSGCCEPSRSACRCVQPRAAAGCGRSGAGGGFCPGARRGGGRDLGAAAGAGAGAGSGGGGAGGRAPRAAASEFFDAIVNCTPVGMHPGRRLAAHCTGIERRVVMDTIYRPRDDGTVAARQAARHRNDFGGGDVFGARALRNGRCGWAARAGDGDAACGIGCAGRRGKGFRGTTRSDPRR